MPDKTHTYTWLPGSRPEGIVEPTERVHGEWKDAWAERLAQWAKTWKPVHVSVLTVKETDEDDDA